MDRIPRHVGAPLGDSKRDPDALVHYAVRHRRTEPVTTLFVGSAVEEIIAERTTTKQRTRWSLRPCSPSSTCAPPC